ncbi:YceI family protein [Lutimonas vermicola]|uniref:YceI family protein n=1 Tax=Lutimonas vermicola TaxID=414288 RepID=A0ABU9L3P7_9FLAO
MNKLNIVLAFLFFVQTSMAQDKYFTKEGYVSFFSHTIVEDIKADNQQVLSIVDTTTGDIAIQLLMRSFQFKKALMQEHFNENYVESYKYPKATFKGVILNLNELVEGDFETEIKGILLVHGREKEVSTMVKVTKKNEMLILTGHFMVEVADFDIKIPSIVANNIAKTIEVSFELKHKPYKQ